MTATAFQRGDRARFSDGFVGTVLSESTTTPTAIKTLYSAVVDRGIPVVAVLSDDGEVRYFDWRRLERVED